MQELKSQEILIDWLEFTIDTHDYGKVIDYILKLDTSIFEKLDRGKLGYKKQVEWFNVFVLWDGNNDMGVHVIMTGKGCRMYENYYTLLELIERINEENGKLTRIDLALDDYTGELIKLNRLIDDITKGNIVSKWKASTEITKRDTNGKILGKTINVGSRSSNTYLRIYDKGLEQQNGEVWYRIELEIKKENAQALQKIITRENVGLLLKGILKNYIRIVEPSSDKNKSRWKTKAYWEKIVDKAEKVKLATEKRELNLDEKKYWIEKQVGQTLATISLAEDSLDFINSVLKNNIENLKYKNKKLVERYKKHDE